ncbi:hypothetical protein HQ496_03050 [bacterium]|nr:hypothetical protein [bacterium]
MRDYSTFFPTLSGSSKVWVYVASIAIDDSTAEKLTSVLFSFGNQWSSHGRIVLSEFDILDHQLIVLGAEVDQGGISGCGIDKSLHVLEEFARETGFEWVSALSIVYRDTEGLLKVVSRPEFRSEVKQGGVTDMTKVIDTSVSVLSEIREGKLEAQAGASWHARVFAIPASSTV